MSLIAKASGGSKLENCVRGINTHLILVFWWNTTAGFA